MRRTDRPGQMAKSDQGVIALWMATASYDAGFPDHSAYLVSHHIRLHIEDFRPCADRPRFPLRDGKVSGFRVRPDGASAT
jgi:hypothetical protein